MLFPKSFFFFFFSASRFPYMCCFSTQVAVVLTLLSCSPLHSPLCMFCYLRIFLLVFVHVQTCLQFSWDSSSECIISNLYCCYVMKLCCCFFFLFFFFYFFFYLCFFQFLIFSLSVPQTFVSSFLSCEGVQMAYTTYTHASMHTCTHKQKETLGAKYPLFSPILFVDLFIYLDSLSWS